MNICQEKERLEKLKNEADIQYRQSMRNITLPLGQNTRKGLTEDDKVKKRDMEQKYKEAIREYELHKKTCHICNS